MCARHPGQEATVCDETRCAGCYAEGMVGERVPDPEKHPGHGRFTRVRDEHGHWTIRKEA